MTTIVPRSDLDGTEAANGDDVRRSGVHVPKPAVVIVEQINDDLRLIRPLPAAADQEVVGATTQLDVPRGHPKFWALAQTESSDSVAAAELGFQCSPPPPNSLRQRVTDVWHFPAASLCAHTKTLWNGIEQNSSLNFLGCDVTNPIRVPNPDRDRSDFKIVNV
jgi:hypothetical protein